MTKRAVIIFPSLVGLLLLWSSLEAVGAFRQPASSSSSKIPLKQLPSLCNTPISAASTTKILLKASKNDNGSSNNKAPSRYYDYKDDCFGFMSFLAGGGTRDPVFAGFFVTLSLTAAFATRLKWLPADPKRDTIVDRKVPGVIAVLTLLLSSTVTIPQEIIDTLLGESVPPPIPEAKMIQYIIGGFSIVTSFLDIRWRDRFDYPEDFRDEEV